LEGDQIDIIPAIDLRNGKCVRLFQGDYQQETIFNDDPLKVALQWQSMGAQRLHIVDLDGARSGESVNFKTVESIAKTVKVPIQLGGGIRTLETIERVLKAGVKRVILGTIAVEDPVLVKTACEQYSDSIIMSIDARDGLVETRGWLKTTGLRAIELAKEMVSLGVRRFIYTDIKRDGTLSGPNYPALSEMMEAIIRPVIAAGGISNIENLKALKKIGVEGAIIGQALYTGNIDLKEALKIAV
jgi:phosphoribosylformimino-5-aminoimidazole carboxamide ribotide isomerase